MSAFDPTTFMGETTTDAGETTYKPVPEGDYLASIGSEERDVKPRVNKDGGVALDIYWEIEDQQLAKALNMREGQKVRVKQGLFLDLDSNGKLAWGTNQNIKLAQVRAALGQNQAGKPWSPRALLGAGPAQITVKHRPDPQDDTKVYSEVVVVAPIARTRKVA